MNDIKKLERQRRRISFDSVVNYDLEYKDDIFNLFDEHIKTKLNQIPSMEIYKKLKLLKFERDQYFLTNLGILFSSKRDDYFPLVKIIPPQKVKTTFLKSLFRPNV